MNILWLIFLIVVILIIVEIGRHKVRHGLFKYLITGILILIFIMILSTYLDFSQFFESNGFFVKTGNIIIDTLSDQVTTIKETNSSFINEISDSTNEIFNNEQIN
ncbi:hypothetical protein CL616_04145 [archaeon]|nr:hypothetical protein [archaeon]|tara:strand:+ start:257 stop:571 length:315 start_codon:yes stop_codon:yes gene_type:complete